MEVASMIQISVSELKANAGKYVTMAQDDDIFITENGKVVAKLVTAKVNKAEAFNRLQGLFVGVSITDAEVEAEKKERMGREHLLMQS